MGKHSNGPIGSGNSPDPHSNEQALDNVTHKQYTQTAQDAGIQTHDDLTTHQEWQDRYQNAIHNGAVSPMQMQHIQQAKNAADQREPSVKQLADQQDNLMAAPSVPTVNHMAVDHEKLWDDIHNDADPETLHGVGDMWTKRANHLTTAQDKLIRGMAASESGWSGDPAERARNASTRLAKHAGQIQSGAHLAGSSLQQQASALTTARITMDKPPSKQSPPEKKYDPADEQRDLQKVQDDPKEYAKVKKHYSELQHNQKVRHQQAARTAQTYDHTTTHLSSSQPAFAPPPKVTSGDGDSTSGGGVNGFSNGGTGNTPPPGTGGTQYGGNRYQDLVGDTGGTGNGWNGAPQLPGDSSTTGPTSTDPSGGGYGDITQRPYLPGGPNGGSGWGDGPGNGRGHGGMMIPPGGGALGGGSGSGSGSGSGTGGGRFGGRGGASGTGRGTGLGEGAGENGSGSGPRAGGRAAAGGRSAAGAAEGEGAAGRGGAAGERAGGRGGRPMMGGRGRGGKGEDDYEHETPDFLEGPDDEFWSPQEKVAPPVIGDWLGQYDPTKPASYNPDRDR